MAQALIRARIPYVPVHADEIAQSAGLPVLVLPNVGALSDAQCEAIRWFTASGGGLVATGETSLYDESGDRRADFALAELLGVEPPEGIWDRWTRPARAATRRAGTHTCA